MLNLWRHLGQKLVGIQRCHSDKSLGGLHNLLCGSALQSLSLQSQRHKVEATSRLLDDSRVLPKIVVRDEIVNGSRSRLTGQ